MPETLDGVDAFLLAEVGRRTRIECDDIGCCSDQIFRGQTRKSENGDAPMQSVLLYCVSALFASAVSRRR